MSLPQPSTDRAVLLGGGRRPWERCVPRPVADATHITRAVGTVIFELDGRKRASTVIFGRRGDAALIGALTLEELGLMLDPLKRELRPMRLLLA